MKDLRKISFIVPVYNNPHCLHEISILAMEACVKSNAQCEIIFVNDGSTDDSFLEITKLSKEFPGIVRGIDLMRNSGQHHATLCGMQHASGNFIITLDDDLSFSPDQAMELLQYMTDNQLDLAYGIPSEKKHGFGRSIGKYLLYVGSSIGSRKIAGASFRAMTATLANQVVPEGDVIFIDDLLTSITSRYHYKSFPNFRKSTGSRYSNASLWKMGMNISFFYSGFPLRIITWIGLTGSIISSLIALYYLYKKLFFHHIPMGYTSTIVAILFSASAVLLGIGILGKYLYRIHGNKNRTHSFYIREITETK